MTGQDPAAVAGTPDLVTAARVLGKQARAMVMESLGAALTPAQRGRVLHGMLAGAPVTVSIRLTPPQVVAIWLADELLAQVEFDPETMQ
jgi:hypothetical protein